MTNYYFYAFQSLKLSLFSVYQNYSSKTFIKIFRQSEVKLITFNIVFINLSSNKKF